MLGRIDQMIKKKSSDVELGQTYFAFDRCGLLLGLKKKGSDVELGSDVLRRTLDNAVATNVR